MKKSPRVVIIGAGAAGLACARELKKLKVNFHILEARDRIGGRAHSAVHSDGVIEYGAEFIHGAQPLIIDLLKKYKFAFTDVSDNRLISKNGKLYEAPDFWEDLEKVTNELNGKRKQDRSVAEFIESHKSHWSKDILEMFVSYVEGYQAADLELAGEKGLAESEAAEEPELNGLSLFRADQGYSHFMDLLYKDAGIRSSQISLHSVVDEIQWSPKSVSISGKNLKLNKKFRKYADVVIVTAPINVLKKSLRISPEIPALTKSLNAVPMGHLQRITFEFTESFWEELSLEKPIGFLHATSGHDFPTWWSQAPKRNRYMIAWQGGPRAYEMSDWSSEEKVAAALKTFSSITRRSQSYLHKHLLKYYTHDWTRDPYSLGAYCYSGIEVPGAELQKIFAGRIIIAGEGTARGAELGTVHGAMKTGMRAAHQVLKIT